MLLRRLKLTATTFRSCVSIKNGAIKHETLRVVYMDPTTNKPEHKVLSRADALSFAKSFGLDLLLVNPSSNPPVCKLVDMEEKETEDRKKEKQRKSNASKAKPMKEIFVSTCIDPHDLETKMTRIKTFLAEGHQVKIGVLAKRRALEKKPSALEECVLKVLELSEEFVSSIQQPPSNSTMRRDLLLTPKK